MEAVRVEGPDSSDTLASKVHALTLLADLPDGLRQDDRSPDWIGIYLARGMDRDVGENLLKASRRNSQNRNRDEFKKLLAEFEKGGFLKVEKKKQNNGSDTRVFEVNRPKIRQKLDLLKPTDPD